MVLMAEDCGSWFLLQQFDWQSPKLNALAAPHPLGQQSANPLFINFGINMVSTETLPVYGCRDLPHLWVSQVNESHGDGEGRGVIGRRRREGNIVAHCMAVVSGTDSEDSFWFEEAPDCVELKALEDRRGWLRFKLIFEGYAVLHSLYLVLSSLAGDVSMQLVFWSEKMNGQLLGVTVLLS
ncbi:hypothetical protein F3Y22_tig00111092pilonHSYRG00060 [Hibiscus syriacus]|uniref:Uncharacterized protein n=1 Tax=Hibiscus syriacus TaxID=106335 RepID=A0A6A2Z1R1_HIBSY|nr:hypothetical protein F3Y22_tig00111092pilonHSYRG00060 [Hibiscus syriacus]